MTAAGLGDIEKFPFIDPPDHRNIRDGVQLLQELGAFGPGSRRTSRKRLTARPAASSPSCPSTRAWPGWSWRPTGTAASARSWSSPPRCPSRTRASAPPTSRPQADQQHARFKDETSDFLAFLNLWRYVREQQKERGSSSFRRMCKQEYLNYLRIREWQDIYAQLRTVAKQMGIHRRMRTTPPPTSVHVSLLAGLLSHIGMKDVKDTATKNEYLGARSAKFAIFPGSALFKKPPRFVMSAELVETSRLWARVNAKIEPEWVEPLAEHLVKRTYSEPHWEKDQAAVMAYEKVTLYGVPIVAQRKVNYGRIDPETSRELFIRNALVEGDWRTHHKFFPDNRKLLTEVEELEHRARRRDILVDDETLFDFYDQRVPEHVVSGAHFDSWWKQQAARAARLPRLRARRCSSASSAEAVTKADYPDIWRQGQLEVPRHVPVRAGRGRGRRDRPHPAPGAQPGHRRGLRLADPGPAGGVGHRADPLPPEADPPQLRPRAGLSRRRSWTRAVRPCRSR